MFFEVAPSPLCVGHGCHGDVQRAVRAATHQNRHAAHLFSEIQRTQKPVRDVGRVFGVSTRYPGATLVHQFNLGNQVAGHIVVEDLLQGGVVAHDHGFHNAGRQGFQLVGQLLLQVGLQLACFVARHQHGHHQAGNQQGRAGGDQQPPNEGRFAPEPMLGAHQLCPSFTSVLVPPCSCRTRCSCGSRFGWKR